VITLPNDLRGKAVLITGGTKGIGLATGLAYGRQGAHVYLTHKWGSVPEDAVRARFAEADAGVPVVLEADVAEDADTVRLLETIQHDHAGLEVLVSNVAFAQVTGELESYQRRSLQKSIGYTAWPFVGYLQHHRKIFGRYPRYAIGLSSDGVENYYPGYDLVAASKKVMETFCKYLNTLLWDEDIRLNVLRARPVSTDSLQATFGPELEPFLRKYGGNDYVMEATEVADAVVALTSGLMDAVSGQVILLDKGVCFGNNLMRLFEHRSEFPL
jgi:NAD(P)-dependent dehydrogenase (short-subunit alcohol dehydrogenase family)